MFAIVIAHWIDPAFIWDYCSNWMLNLFTFQTYLQSYQSGTFGALSQKKWCESGIFLQEKAFLFLHSAYAITNEYLDLHSFNDRRQEDPTPSDMI